MLQFIRERVQGLVAGVIILFLCLTFLLWGIDEYIRASHRVIVAEVKGEKIDLETYQKHFQRLRQRAQAEMGDKFDSAMWSDNATKLKALDMLVEERLLSHAVEDSRLRISNPQIAAFIRGAETFNVDGKFSLERYKQAVNMLGFTETSFESQVRSDLAVQQLRAGVALSTFVTKPEAERLAQLFLQKRDVGYAILEPADPASIALSDADAEAYFKANQEKFRVPEKVSLEYLELTLDALKKEVAVDDKSLAAYYESSKAKYTTEEQRSANHILVQVKKDAPPADDAAARLKIETLRKLIEGGMSFEEVAKQNSDDAGSRAEGGDTGLFPRGVMAPEFEKAAFSLQPGELSEPVRTDFGYHLIRVREIKPGGVKTFEQVHAEVEDAYRSEQAENMYFERAEQFTDAVNEHPDSLAAAGEGIALKPQTTGELSRQEVEERFAPAVAEAAWEPEVLTEGLASAPVEIGNTRSVAVRVLAHAPAHIPAFNDVKADVIKQVREERVHEDVLKRGEALIERLKKEEPVATLMAAEKLEWVDVKGATRESDELNRAVARAVFKAPVAADGKPVYVGVPLGTGAYAVARITNLQLPNVDLLEGRNVDAIRRDAVRAGSAIGWRGFLEQLRKDGKVQTYPDRL